MELFSALILKIWPLYTVVLLGYISGKYLKIDRAAISSLLFYVIVPVVFFDVGLDVKMEASYFLLPVVLLIVSAIMCFCYLYFSKLFWKDKRANLIAFSAGSGNTGYFGFPVALMLFDEPTVALYMLGNIGLSIYDYTIGAYVITRGDCSKLEAFKKVLTLPIIYAFSLGVLFNYFNIQLPQEALNVFQHFRGTYVVLGMMIIGLGLSAVDDFKVDLKFLNVFLSARFIASPLLTLLLIYLDKNLFGMFVDNAYIYKILILLSIVPPGANSIIYANLYNCYPEKAATAVLIGTLIAIVYMPAMIALLF